MGAALDVLELVPLQDRKSPHCPVASSRRYLVSFDLRGPSRNAHAKG